jgi:argininosuccinate lyase
LKELSVFSKAIEADIFDHLTVEAMISRRLSDGGTARKNVRAAIDAAKANLKQQAVGEDE